MAPFDLSSIADTAPYYLIFLALGLAFGAVLEMSGFGDSRKLAAQFYLKDMTVLKVMFTAIVTACVLIFSASAIGILDFSFVAVPPTYLMPGIIGGLIMGVGFIIGGFCPGTSVVAAGTLKLDGIAFVGGVGIGTLLFSETASLLTSFRYSTFMGRFLLSELFGLPEGVTVLLLVGMALLMFYGAELAERRFGRGEAITRAALIPRNRFTIAGAGALLGTAALVAVIGQPSAEEKWPMAANRAGISLENRDPYVHPAEIAQWRADSSVSVRMLDVRSEGDFNRFHILGAIRVSPSELTDSQFIRSLQEAPANTLTFVVSNGETRATAAWKQLLAQGLTNLYIVEGGINNWLTVFPPDACIAVPVKGRQPGEEELAFAFTQAVGDDCYSAHPEVDFKESPTDCYLEAHPELKQRPANDAVRPVPFDRQRKVTFQPKVKMKKAGAPKGGCG